MRIKSFLVFLCPVVMAFAAAIVPAQNFSRYEVEILSNPTPGKKDTREVNSVIIFEQDKVIVKSRRKDEIFKEIKYSDLKFAQHSFSKRPWITQAAVSAIATAFTGLPFYLSSNEKHWMTVVGDKDFFVLKLENDNFRQVKAEFLIRGVEIEEVSEGKDASRAVKKDKDADKKQPEQDKKDQE